MRNLRNIRFVESALTRHLPLTGTTWDPATDGVICAFGPTEDAAVIEIRRKPQFEDTTSGLDTDELSLIASWDAPCPLPDLKSDRILLLQYFADTLTTCLVMEGGDIIVVRDDPQPGEEKIEIVGTVDVGIDAAAWSPDEELLAIYTKSNTLLYMTREFDSIANITLTPEDLKVSQHVSVGWGKKETQFQGKRAKALRDPTVPEKVDEGKLSDFDDGKISLSWRGDGAYLAVNSVESGARRVIRVYSREGRLDSVSEPVDGLEGALSWRPAGNLIAGIQRRDDRIDVVFFERNGLRHGEFTLRLNKGERETWASNIQLDWNIDSTVLAVKFKDRVQLWTMGNYHYYLKQEIPICPGLERDNCLLNFRWHHEKATRFVAGSSNVIIDADWVFDVVRGSTLPSLDFGCVAVIDGRTIKLTPLRISGVPPPMSLCDIVLDFNAIDVAFSKSSSRIAVLTSNGVSVHSWDLRTVDSLNLKQENFFPFSRSSERARQICFLGETDVYVLKQRDFASGDIERIDLVTGKSVSVFQSNDTGHLAAMFSNLEQNVLWLSQRFRQRKELSYSILAYEGTGAPSVTPWVECPAQDTCWALATQLYNGEHILFSLSRSGALYANKRLLTKSCTSFMLTAAHVIFTTTQHLLKFVHLTAVDDLDVPGDTPEEDERCRNIERGGRLVHVMPTTFALTLQMPRGNTETIYPRALVLAGIRQYIEQKKYKSAYLACRSHMVDMNIIHDYAPAQFMENIPLFIVQVKKVEFIDEFLSRLKNEDVCQTLYKDTLKIAHTREQAAQTSNQANHDAVVTGGVSISSKDNKVNRICDGFLSALSGRIDTNLQNLVTAHVCKSPPDLDAGLQLVAKLRKQSVEQAEEAVEHMCFLTDANRLFDNALGLYDLELTLMVAQQAQKDPKEYLPFLQKLQAMPELLRRYEIDNHLGRHGKALKSLHALQKYDDLKLYAIKHSLYKEVLELYKYQPDLHRDMYQVYADYLYDQSNYKEAAVAYESLGLYESAYKSYNLAHMWRECLFCASLVPLAKPQLTELAQSLATTLTEETKDYASAAQIHFEYLNDISAAARLFCRGFLWGDACRILALHGQASLIEDIVDSSLADAMGNITELLADCRSQLLAQVPRIRELRIRRANDPLGFYGGDPTGGPEGADIPDNVSLAPTDASTMAGRSLFTRYTGSTSASRKTSRTRRREERKRARGKKGTVYEEEYLVNSVRRLIEKVNSTIGEVETLVLAMLRRGMRERAALVERNLDEVLGMCRDSLEEVFETGKEAKPAVQGPNGAQPSAIEGMLETSFDVGLGEKPREAPIVKNFKKLALLAG
ncbi:hypothetical protein VTO42DRAFT_8775 [Malbranchea cinnamomea]